SSGPGALTAGLDALGNFTLTFPRNLHADDVTLVVDASEDLLIWYEAGLIATENMGSGIARETWGIQALGKPAMFLRLRAVPRSAQLQLGASINENRLTTSVSAARTDGWPSSVPARK